MLMRRIPVVGSIMVYIAIYWQKLLHAVDLRRLAGVSATESQPRVQRALDLTDDAESNMPPPAPQERPQRRGQLQRTSCVSRASHHEVQKPFSKLSIAVASAALESVSRSALQKCCKRLQPARL